MTALVVDALLVTGVSCRAVHSDVYADPSQQWSERVEMSA